MNGKVFIEQLKQSWKQALYWGIGVGFLTFFMSIVVEDPAVLEGYSNLIGAFPPAILSAFGVSDAALLTTAEGFIVFAGFTYGSIILSVFGVLAGLNIINNDEDSGMMNMILALPTPRWQVVVERFLAYIVIVFIILLLLFAGVLLGTIIFSLDIDLMLMFMGSMNLMPMILAIIAMTALFSGLFSNRMIVTGLSATFVLVSYVINTLVGAINVEDVPFADIIGKISIYNYVNSEGIIINQGLSIANIAILLAIATVAIAITVYAFENRDISG
ncbi:MAG: hypothetical protein Phog2KO_09510 [Phototrophicaceae bacterium]